MSRHAAVALKKSYRPHIPLLVKFVSAGCTGVLLGIFVTLAVVEHGKGFGAVEAGPWTAWPRSPSADIDPYSRAILAYSGQTPLSESDAVTFVARTDSSGEEFDPACDYVLTGKIPSARYWTLALVSPAGAPIANPADRQAFSSSELLRTSGGKFEIIISRHARPGNWLPLGDASKFILVLRLYDSGLSASPSTLEAADMPRLVRGRCG